MLTATNIYRLLLSDVVIARNIMVFVVEMVGEIINLKKNNVANNYSYKPLNLCSTLFHK